MNKIVDMMNIINEISKSSFYYKMDKFKIFENSDEIIKHIDISDCIEFASNNGQELLIYNTSEDGRKHIKYSALITTIFDIPVIEDVYDYTSKKVFEFDYDKTFERIKKANNK